MAHRAGVERLVINGSFVTDVYEPNDVDCVLRAPTRAKDTAAEEMLLKGLPFLDISLVRQTDFDYLVYGFFAADRQCAPKGMIEVSL